MTYPGGKGGAGVYQTIINQMPPHDVYIEAFFGGGTVMRRKRPAATNIGIDRNRAAVRAGQRLHGRAAKIIQADARIWLAAVPQWTGRELVYADPPYPFAKRKSVGEMYAHELGTWGEHQQLLAVLKRLPCMVMISSYPSALYREELEGWRMVEYQSITRGGKMATENLWCNFPEPRALHDYRYLGADFRQRERIKRKAARWRAKLEGLDPLEQKAVLTACLSASI